jgi:hypothetical protein
MNTTHPETLIAISTQLTLVGNCGYQIQGHRIVISIDEIASQRDLDDLSGTLSSELWALKRPYQGGDFSGMALVGTRIEELLSRHCLTDCRYDLLFQEPPAGTWYLTLMLRESTNAGFVTRDYVNFALPYVGGSKPAVISSETDNVINVGFTANEKAAAKSVAEQPAVAQAEAPKSESPKAQVLLAETVSTPE